MNLFDEVRKYFNKDLIDSAMEEMESQSDYYLGEWGYCGLFMGDLCNYKLLKSEPNFLNLITSLKNSGCISASINRYSSDTVVYPHTDTDLIGENNILRCFVPLETNYLFEFSGLSIVDGIQVYNSKSIYNKDIVFVPQKDHEYKNLDDKEQYFLIIDLCADDSVLTEKFWKHYFHFAVDNYL